MKTMHSLLFAVLGLALLGMGGKPPVVVRFFVEANAHDTETFATPIKLHNPDREAFIEKTPTISERMIEAIYPFQAASGMWGCSFKLDQRGRLALEVASSTRRGSSIIAFLGTKAGTHQVIDMVIDKTIIDGIITIPYGLTELEVASLTKEYRVIGAKKKKK